MNSMYQRDGASKITIIFIAVLIVFSSVMSFGLGGKENKTEPEKKQTREILKVAIESMPVRWDPAGKYSNNSAQIHGNLHDGLVRIELNGKPKPIPAIAESWKKISPTVTEFKIRKGVKFWDGSEVTVEDVEWSLGRIIRKEHPRFKSYGYGRVLYNFTKVEIVDDSTVRIHTNKPEPMLFILLGQTPAAILSKAAFEAAGKDYSAYMRKPVGCGPYRIKEVKNKEFIKLERFEDYWGAPAPLKELHYYLVKEPAARITALVNGEVDFIVSIPPDLINVLDGRKGVKTLRVQWHMFHTYALNGSRHPLDDQRIRHALNMAIDREALNNGLWGGNGVVPTSFQYKGTQDFDPKWNVFEYNPEKARALVKEANYDGTPVELDFQPGYYLYSDQAATAIEKMWKDIGLNVKMRYVEEWEPRDPKAPEKANMMRSWSAPMYFPDLIGGFDPHFSPTGWPVADGWIPEWGENGKYRDKYIKLYEDVRYGTDAKERKKAYRKLIEHADNEVSPWLFLYQPFEYFAMDEDIQWTVPINYRPFTLPFRDGAVSFK